MNWTVLGRVVPLLALCAFAVAAGRVWAHEVSPMRVSLVPAEGRSQATVTINNTRDEPLPVEIKTLIRHTSPDGAERLEEVTDVFIIFPPQVLVPARSSQAVRIQYVGPPVIDQSLAYVVEVVETPVETPGFTGVRFTYNFGVAVYVDPPRAVDRLSVVAAERSDEGLRVVVRNSGAKYGLLNLNRLIVTAGDQRFDLTADDLGGRIDNPLLPPGMDRVFDVRLPELAAEGPVSAEVRSR